LEQYTDSNSVINVTTQKRVKFANKVNNRIYEEVNILENGEKEVVINDNEAYFDDPNFETFTDISFEKDLKFLINDDYYKISNTIPKTIEHISYFNHVNENETNSEKTERVYIKDQITTIFNSLLERPKNNIYNSYTHQSNNNHNDTLHYRVDGILYNNQDKKLIIITDKYIIDYNYESNKFVEKIKILIVHVDFITLTRDNNYIILHLVRESRKANYAIANKNLNGVVGCLSSTFFYDKHNYAYPKDKNNVVRKIPVILVNQNMTELIEILQKTSNFWEYKDAYNNYIHPKLKQTLNMNVEIYIYTCVNYKEAEDEKYKQGDLVLNQQTIYLVEFVKNNYELILKIPLKSITKMKNNDKRNSFIIFDNIISPEGLEIRSDNFLGIRDLVTKTIQGVPGGV